MSRACNNDHFAVILQCRGEWIAKAFTVADCNEFLAHLRPLLPDAVPVVHGFP